MSSCPDAPAVAAGDAAPVLLGVDVGSTATKVSLITADGAGAVTELAVRSAPTAEDAVVLAASVDTLIRAVLPASTAAPAAAGIASMAETGVPLDAGGVPLRALIRWNSAADPYDAESLAAAFGADRLFSATGVRPGPKAPLARWAQLRRTQPELWDRMAHWAGVAELITHSLTGRLVTDHTLAGRTMAYRLPAAGEDLSRGFDPELLAAAGLRAEQLAAVALPGESAGMVTAGAAVRTGLRPGTPVVVAGHDHAVGAWGAGIREPGQVADSLGTAEALVRILDRPPDPSAVAAAGMSLTRTVSGAHLSLLAGTASAGALIRWWLQVGGADAAGRDSEAAETGVEAVAVDTAALPTGLLVLPYLAGRQSPVPNPAARLRFLDSLGRPFEPASRPPAEVTQALFEGLALQLRWMDAEQHRLAGASGAQPITVLGAAGTAGGAWLRTKATVMAADLSVVTAAAPVASGAALLAGVRLGLVGDQAVLPRSPVPAPPDHGSRYEQMFAAFVAAATKDGEGQPPEGLP